MPSLSGRAGCFQGIVEMEGTLPNTTAAKGCKYTAAPPRFFLSATDHPTGANVIWSTLLDELI